MKKVFSKKVRLLIGLFFIGLSLFFLNKIGSLSLLKDISFKTGSPFVYFFSKLGNFFDDAITIFTKPLEIKNENKKIKEENLYLQSRLIQLEEKEKENQILREQLNILKQANYQFLGAQVIAQNPEPFFDSIIINRGKKDGVERGMAVVFSGFLVGEISEVNENSSRVLLVNSSLSTIGGITQNTRVEGLVRGEIGGKLIMEKISQDENVEIGEAIITSGLGGKIKKGIPIGRVSEVINLEGGLFKKINIESPINFKKLEFVFVVK